MRVTITAQLFDLEGVLIIDTTPGNERGSLSRRFAKVATTDGGVAINDRGFAHGDREFEYRWLPVSRAHDDIAKRLVRLHARVLVSNDEGVFECVPVRFDPSPSENSMTLSVISKLSED